jgi:hypothetical protein
MAALLQQHSNIDALRPRASGAFEEFFFSRAREVYPRDDFARMNDDEFGASLRDRWTPVMSAIDAVDGSSLGTRVPSMWALF